MEKAKQLYRGFYVLLGQSRFMQIVLAIFCIQALWLALTANYPMAFDEDFHFGVIKVYAGQPHPFLKGEPVGANTYGALARDPSYLFHFLFSIPFSVLQWFKVPETAIIIIFRLMNIGLLATSFPLFKRLLQECGATVRQTHLILLYFAVVPILPFLGAQINYDNLMIPLTALALLLATKLYRAFRAGRPALRLSLFLLTVCLLTSIVKYAFIPIFLGIVLALMWAAARGGLASKTVWPAIKRQWQAMSVKWRLALAMLFLISVVLFGQRVLVNLAEYQDPVPPCDKVLSVDACSAYGPWYRDYVLHQSKTETNDSPLFYMREWLYGMWLRLYFAVDGPRSQYETRGPLFMPAVGALVFAAIGILSGLLDPKRYMALLRQPALLICLFSAFIYIALLWVQQYKMFAYTGQPVAINGRYLLPVLPFLLLVIAQGYRVLWDRQRIIAASAVTLLFVSAFWGGGALTYILRSNPAWYWSSTPVKRVNLMVQRLVGPVTPGSGRPEAFMK